MTSTPATCRPDESIEGCEYLMKRHQVRRIPVVDSSGVCVGIVSQADIALRDTPEHIKETLAAVSQHRASGWRITTEDDLTPASAQAFQIAQPRRRLEEPIGITWLPTIG